MLYRFLQPRRAGIIFFTLLSLLSSVSALAQKKNKKKEKASSQNEIILAENEVSRYRIIIPSAATDKEVKAANVLQKYLLEISGTAIPIIKANDHLSRYEIVLGQNERLDELKTGINLNSLKQDGFLIKTDSMRLIIAGGSGKGTLYGVYTFLEKYLGCRMYSPTVKIIPKQNRISLASIHDLQVPVITFRDTHYRVTWHEEYSDWHKLNHDEHGERTDWGMWCHTFNSLVPPEIYYKEHPEYYAMVNGERIPTQLCRIRKCWISPFKIYEEKLLKILLQRIGQ